MNATLMLPLLRATVDLTERLAPAATDGILRALFLTPRRHAPLPRERRFLATGAYRRLATSAGPVATWTWGHGPRVVLLHGWAGRAGQFRRMAEWLVASGFSVTAFDAPAHGRSPGLRSSLLQFAEALDGVVGHLGPVHAVVGHSLGGAALALSLNRGLPADHAVLIGAPAVPRRFYHQLMGLLGIPESAWARHDEAFAARFNGTWEGLEGARLLATRTVPVLVVHDHLDREVPFAEAEALAAAPTARLHATHGLGHRRILQDRQVHREILTFLGGRLPCAEADLEAELFNPELR